MIIPKNLDECLEYLDLNVTADEKIDFALMDERGAICAIHFGAGMSMRNSWGLWGNNDLTRFFNDLGIYHADDMSSIIYTSFHRKLHGQDLDLVGQINHYIEYWIKAGYKNGNPKNPRI